MPRPIRKVHAEVAPEKEPEAKSERKPLRSSTAQEDMQGDYDETGSGLSMLKLPPVGSPGFHTVKTFTMDIPFSYVEKETNALGDRTRWYYAGQCNVAMVTCFKHGTRMGNKKGSNFVVYMPHRTAYSNGGDWFDHLKDVENFILDQLEAKAKNT